MRRVSRRSPDESGHVGNRHRIVGFPGALRSLDFKTYWIDIIFDSTDLIGGKLRQGVSFGGADVKLYKFL